MNFILGIGPRKFHDIMALSQTSKSLRIFLPLEILLFNIPDSMF